MFEQIRKRLRRSRRSREGIHHTVTIVGTHIDHLTGDETATIRDKADVLEFLETELREDYGYSLIVAVK